MGEALLLLKLAVVAGSLVGDFGSAYENVRILIVLLARPRWHVFTLIYVESNVDTVFNIERIYYTGRKRRWKQYFDFTKLSTISSMRFVLCIS